MDRFIDIFYSEDGSYRAKQLFRVRGRILGNIGQDRRLIKESWALRRFSSRQHSSTGGYAFYHVRVQGVHSVRGRQRTNIGLLIKRVAPLQHLHSFSKFALKLIVDLLV